jgi:hypothetical protein
MVTVQNFLNEVRYDTRDFTKHDFDDTQFVVYLNRAMRLLADELSRRRASDVYTTKSLDQADGNIYIDVSTYDIIAPREIWRGQNFVYKKPMEWIYRQRQLSDTSATPSGTPLNWGWDDYNQYIAFDYENNSGSAISFTVFWDVYPTAVTTASDMPYNDKYNSLLREGLLVLAKKSKRDEINNVDSAMQELFKSKMQREVIHRRIKQKRHYLDF